MHYRLLLDSFQSPCALHTFRHRRLPASAEDGAVREQRAALKVAVLRRISSVLRLSAIDFNAAKQRM